MELHFTSIPVLLSILLFAFMVFKIAMQTKSKTSNSKLPPGPRCWSFFVQISLNKGFPLIGNMHQLAVPGSLPHHTLRKMAEKYGPLMHLKLGEVSTIIVTSAEIAKEVLKTNDIIFAQRPSLLASRILSYDSSNIVFSPYGDYWRQMRKICVLELLSSKRVQTFQHVREEEALNLIRSISKERELPINLSKKIYSLTYGIIGRVAFGAKSKYQEEFISVAEEATALAAGFTLVDMYPSIKLLELITGFRRKLEKIHKKQDQILQSVVRDHRERRTTKSGKGETESEDLVDVLLRIQEQGDLEHPLTDDNIKAVLLDIFAAGSETSSTIVEWAMSELMKNPQLLKRAQDEVRDVFDKKGNVDETDLHKLKYLNAIVKETLRLHPSAPLLVPRESSEKCIVSGYEVPAKTRVIINAWAIGQDPKYWTDPKKFDPERFINSEIDYKGRDFEYIPFGAGRRICPGMSFALPNMELPLAQFLYHFDWELPNRMKAEEVDMEEKFGLTVRRKHDLYLIPIPYHLSSVK